MPANLARRRLAASRRHRVAARRREVTRLVLELLRVVLAEIDEPGADRRLHHVEPEGLGDADDRDAFGIASRAGDAVPNTLEIEGHILDAHADARMIAAARTSPLPVCREPCDAGLARAIAARSVRPQAGATRRAGRLRVNV